jgi:hypothetical protein
MTYADNFGRQGFALASLLLCYSTWVSDREVGRGLGRKPKSKPKNMLRKKIKILEKELGKTKGNIEAFLKISSPKT